jgi:hypothetical protein
MRCRIRHIALMIAVLLCAAEGGPARAQSPMERAPFDRLETLVARIDSRASALRGGKLSQRRAELVSELLLQDADQLAQFSELNTQLAIRTPFIRQSAGEVGDAVMARDRRALLRATKDLRDQLRDFRVFLAVAEGRRAG